MECLVTLKAVPESGPCAELASETGTPRWVASSVSAHPAGARASSSTTDARVANLRFTRLLETDGAGRVWRAPKGAASRTLLKRGFKPIRRRQPQSHTGPAAEHAMRAAENARRAAVELLRIVGDVDPHEPEAEVAPDYPAEVRLVVLTARRKVRVLVVPDTRRDVGLDADPRRRQRHADTDRTQHRGRRRHGVGARRTHGVVPRAQLQADRERDQAAADEAEGRGAAVRGRPGVLALGFP